MNFRKAFLFIVSLVLTCGVVLAQQGTPVVPNTPETQVFSWQGDGPGNFSFFMEGGSFLGVHAEDINKENMASYNMREARGVGITEVVKDSPAEKAGLRKGDVILRFEGDSVTSARKLTRLVSEVAPDQTVRLAISRSGGEQELSVTIAKRDNKFNAFHRLEGLKGLENLKKFEGADKLKELHKLFPPDGPGAKTWKWGGPGGEDGMLLALGNHRRIGVSTMQLTKQLADYFGIADGKGVLVTAVTDDSPAAKAGLKAGDVITAIDGEKIEGSGDLSRTINKKKDGDVTLTVVRNKNQRTINVTPKAAESLLKPGTIRQAGGRTIVVPRIELGSFPAVNVSVPRITLPLIPEINIQVPGKIVMPRVIRTRTSQPI
ncbi:MAG TPA: PDZ domain-containing protein [Pyrinomonadaceae bacterium]|nr:PDZ domain-containing protein [Pyrinomonadaceae bacterium]